jgi:hypothetical protein
MHGKGEYITPDGRKLPVDMVNGKPVGQEELK